MKYFIPALTLFFGLLVSFFFFKWLVSLWIERYVSTYQNDLLEVATVARL